MCVLPKLKSSDSFFWPFQVWIEWVWNHLCIYWVVLRLYLWFFVHRCIMLVPSNGHQRSKSLMQHEFAIRHRRCLIYILHRWKIVQLEKIHQLCQLWPVLVLFPMFLRWRKSGVVGEILFCYKEFDFPKDFLQWTWFLTVVQDCFLDWIEIWSLFPGVVVSERSQVWVSRLWCFVVTSKWYVPLMQRTVWQCLMDRSIWNFLHSSQCHLMFGVTGWNFLELWDQDQGWFLILMWLTSPSYNCCAWYSRQLLGSISLK